MIDVIIVCCCECMDEFDDFGLIFVILDFMVMCVLVFVDVLFDDIVYDFGCNDGCVCVVVVFECGV